METFRKSLIALAVLGAVVVLSLSAGLLIPSPLPTAAAEPDKKAPRKFYLTRTDYNGGQVLTACATGFHMASLWEVHSPSNLRYDTTLGFTQDDSGSGPPTAFTGGWIRTGHFSTASGTPGNANCQAWTNASNTSIGTVAAIVTLWGESDATAISPWVATTLGCHLSVRVWCVED